MYSKKYGYSKTVTLFQTKRDISQHEYTILCMVAERVGKELFGLHPKKDEYVSTTSSRDYTAIQISYYPMLDHIHVERKAKELLNKYLVPMKPYLKFHM